MRNWSQLELDILKNNYASRGAKFVARETGRSLNGVYSMAFEMGIKTGKKKIMYADAHDTKLIKELRDSGFSYCAIAEKFELSRYKIQRILKQ